MFDLDNARKFMQEEGFEALVPFSAENAYYVSGTYMTSHFLFNRLLLPVIPLDGDPALVTQVNEAVQTRAESWIKDVRTYYSEFERGVMGVLVDLLKEMGLENGRIGIDREHISAPHYQELCERLPGAKFDEFKKIFEKMRMIKSPDEIEILRNAARATEKSILAAFEIARVGDTELSIAKNMTINLVGQGALLTCAPKYFMAFGSGKRSYINHPQPTEKKVRKGEAIRVDLGGMFSGYWSDISGYATVGKPSKLLSKDYEKLIKILDETLEFLKPGARASDVYDCCKKLYEKHELRWDTPEVPQFLVGHGIGLAIHEAPALLPLDNHPLQQNMVLCIEISGPWSQRQALAIEDLVVITKDGVKLLSEIQLEPYVVS